MKKITIQWNKKGVKIDLGKKNISLFEIIHYLSFAIDYFCKYGYNEEEKKFKKNSPSDIKQLK